MDLGVSSRESTGSSVESFTKVLDRGFPHQRVRLAVRFQSELTFRNDLSNLEHARHNTLVLITNQHQRTRFLELIL